MNYSVRPNKKLKLPKTLPQRRLGLIPLTAGGTLKYATSDIEKIRLPVISKTKIYED